ncbi:MAG: glycosyltransferase family 4 protein [Rhodobiaceae bacterium]|nr:glycosyltransferase family 4 protein [Rhodobiaceae bacterium]
MAPRGTPSGVVIVTPGGRHLGGGIGAVTRDIEAGLKAQTPPVPTYVLDPRGEGSILKSLWYFPKALIAFIFLRIFRGCDVAHVQVSERTSFIRKLVFVILGRLLGMRVVLHHHGAELIPWTKSASGLANAIVSRTVNTASLNLVLGQVWRDYLIETYKVPPKNVRVLPNGVADIADRIAQLRGGEGAPSGNRVLLLANLSPRKGVGELLRAVARLNADTIPVTLVCAGGGEVDRYRAEAADLGLSNVEFTGWLSRNDVLDQLSKARLIVLPSYNEGLPITILEGGSAGIPAIATPVGAIPEFFHDGKDIVLVEPGDVDALAAAMARLLTDPALYDAVAASARETFERQFRLDIFWQRILDAYAGR